MTNDLFGQDPVKGAAGDALETREHVDILIIGGGLAGLSAGLRAMELGCRSILIIDKTSGEGQDWGGCSLVAGGSFLIPVSRAEQDVKAYAAAIYEKGLKKGRTDLIETMAEHAWDALDWMVAQGVKYTKPVSVFPASPEVLTAVTAMKTAMLVLRGKYRGAGGRLVYGTKAMRLELDASGVCGALVQGPDDLFYRIAAKKTLLCTGGYAANKQFRPTTWGKWGRTSCAARPPVRRETGSIWRRRWADIPSPRLGRGRSICRR